MKIYKFFALSFKQVSLNEYYRNYGEVVQVIQAFEIESPIKMN